MILYEGDCRDSLAKLDEGSVDACVTDPPYGLSFMGKGWDHGVPGIEFWRAVYRVLKPGAHLLAFGGTRTYHRLVCAIEDAGFEIRDQIGWAYGSGFPKSLDVSKAIDKAAGVEREVLGPNPWQARTPTGTVGLRGNEFSKPDETVPATPEAAAWQGWGTAFKPAWEPICVARKPLAKGMTVAANVLRFGTGALNIDGCRVETSDALGGGTYSGTRRDYGGEWQASDRSGGKGSGLRNGVGDFVQPLGRWPANLCHDGSDEVLACFPRAPGQIARESSSSSRKDQNVYGARAQGSAGREPRADVGSAARFFYCTKASKSERGEGNDHPTVKPLALMRWLVRLVMPPGGTVLDPFAGSGTTGIAAMHEGFDAVLMEQDPAFCDLIARRIDAVDEDYLTPKPRKEA